MAQAIILKINQEFLNAIEEVMGTGTTYSSDLDRVGKHLFGAEWRGVFASDDALPSNGCYIVNTDKKSGPGEHWMAVHNGFFYDSFGRKSKTFLPNMKLKEAPDYDAEQNKKEENCGSRCLAWLLCAKHYPLLIHYL